MASSNVETTEENMRSGLNIQTGRKYSISVKADQVLEGLVEGDDGPLAAFPFKLLASGADGRELSPEDIKKTPNARAGRWWLTDEDGRYRFEGLPKGDYSLRFPAMPTSLTGKNEDDFKSEHGEGGFGDLGSAQDFVDDDGEDLQEVEYHDDAADLRDDVGDDDEEDVDLDAIPADEIEVV